MEVVVRPRTSALTTTVAVSEYERVKLFDYQPTELERKIIENVEKTHPQLSLMVLWNLTVLFARLGNMNLCVSGSGKSASVKSLADHVTGIEYFRADAGFTPVYIAQNDLEVVFESKPVEILVDDYEDFLATASETQMHTFLFLSQLVYEKRYYGRVKGHPVIRHSDVGVTGSGTYNLGKEAMSRGVWLGKVRDRFFRYYHFYLDYPLDLENIPKIEKDPPRWGVTLQYSPIPSKFGDATSINLKKLVFEMFRSQMSDARAKVYCEQMLKAHAWYNGRDVIDDSDCKFLLLFRPFLRIENCFIQRMTLEVPEEGVRQSRGMTFNDIAPEVLFHIYRGTRAFEDLKQVTKLRDRTLKAVLNNLKGKMIREENGKYYPYGNFRDEVEHAYKVLGKGF